MIKSNNKCNPCKDFSFAFHLGTEEEVVNKFMCSKAFLMI